MEGSRRVSSQKQTGTGRLSGSGREGRKQTLLKGYKLSSMSSKNMMHRLVTLINNMELFTEHFQRDETLHVLSRHKNCYVTWWECQLFPLWSLHNIHADWIITLYVLALYSSWPCYLRKTWNNEKEELGVFKLRTQFGVFGWEVSQPPMGASRSPPFIQFYSYFRFNVRVYACPGDKLLIFHS